MTNIDKAFEVQTIIQANEKKRRELFMQNALLLSGIKHKKLYKELLGDVEATWAAFLSQTEIFYSRAQIDRMIKVYTQLTIELNIPPKKYDDVPQSRLLNILTLISKETAEEWFERAKILTGKDWNISMREAKGLVTEEDKGHKHNDDHYLICKDCGSKRKDA